MNVGSSVHHTLLVTSHDCPERDLLEALRDGAESKSNFVVELVFFDLEHSTIFLWFSPWSIAYDRAASRRCTWCRRPQRDHEYVTALFQASHHSERDRNHFERPDSLLHISKSGTVER